MIITFYSYKGGVGRSMALANVAQLLYSKGLRVVVIDWDLEAPGIERFFIKREDELETFQLYPGVIDLLLKYQRLFPKLKGLGRDDETEVPLQYLQNELKGLIDLNHYLYPLYTAAFSDDPSHSALWILPAGMRAESNFHLYAEAVQNFDWADFYASYQGEAFFEWIRWYLYEKQQADVILIDSRTGITEMGGVCTRQLADAVALFVAPNQQNLYGVLKMADSLRNEKLLENDRNGRPLELIFVPSRVDHDEAGLLDTFATDFHQAFVSLTSPLVKFEKNNFLDLKIPYVAYYAYQENIAVKEPDRPSASDLVEAYEKLTATLAQAAPVQGKFYRLYYPGQSEFAETEDDQERLIELKDIMLNAHVESNQMRHYYIGVEHLFIALLEIHGGLTRGIIEDQGFTPEYVIDAIRRKIGKGTPRRLWAGTPSTPRCMQVLELANEFIATKNRSAINERDLLRAILKEGRNIPVRVLRSLGLNLGEIENLAVSRALNRNLQQPYIQIEFGEKYTKSQELSPDHLSVLRRMFQGYALVRLEQELSGGYTTSHVMVATPINADGREDTSVIVKIDATESILDEAQRYETHVKSTLPPLTARLEEKPTAPSFSPLAGIKYTLVAQSGQAPRDIGSVVQEYEPDRMRQWFRDQLYANFGRAWWQQRRSYILQVWAEYDWVLPPVLKLRYIAETDNPTNTHVLRVPVKRSRLDRIHTGDYVALESFMIRSVHPQEGRINLSIGRGTEAGSWAYGVEVQDIDLSTDVYFRGEVVERLVGEVLETRRDILYRIVQELNVPFNIEEHTITVPAIEEHKLPNPIKAYDAVLERSINGSTSKIHGNLHFSNILVGPNDSAFLIDFEMSREGHTLFDWATLEVSWLSEIITRNINNQWADLYDILRYIKRLNDRALDWEGINDPSLQKAIAPLVTIRTIVDDLLTAEGDWDEYYVALSLLALRVMCSSSVGQDGRRLMYLVSALMMGEMSHKPLGADTENLTSSPDETGFDE